MSKVYSCLLAVKNLSDPSSFEPCTPNHLITMKSTIALPPPGNFCQGEFRWSKERQCGQYLLEQFWRHWKKEYLHNVAVRQRWLVPYGDIAMINDEMLPRNE